MVVPVALFNIKLQQKKCGGFKMEFEELIEVLDEKGNKTGVIKPKT